MLIRVMYDKNHQDMVSPEDLGLLIEQRRIIKFKRASGWVDIRTDPVRKAKRLQPWANERRQAQPGMSSSLRSVL